MLEQVTILSITHRMGANKETSGSALTFVSAQVIGTDVVADSTQTRWFKRARVSEREPSMRLFCFPYAGASGEAVYAGWRDVLGPEIELCMVQLPGHWGRMDERPERVLTAIVDGLYDAIASSADKPFAFFGYSMGAALAGQLALTLQERAQAEPEHLFLAALAPSVTIANGQLHLLEGEQLIRTVERLLDYKFPPALLDDAALRREFIDVLRADFELVETHTSGEVRQIQCPITCYAGADDNAVPPEACSDWRAYTTGPFDLIVVPGGHFFIDTLGHDLARDVFTRLKAYTP